jgi:hypothetical protein
MPEVSRNTFTYESKACSSDLSSVNVLTEVPVTSVSPESE